MRKRVDGLQSRAARPPRIKARTHDVPHLSLVEFARMRGLRPFTWLGAVLFGLSMLAGTAHAAACPDTFERATPEAAGYSSAKLDELRTFLEGSGSDSLMLLHDGKVFFEWGDIHKKMLVHSMRKALLSSLVGIAVERGRLRLDATLQQ